LHRAVVKDSVSLERINDAVKRILRQKFRLGLFKNPYPEPNLIPKIGSKSHRDKARQAVRESLVLLKNRDNTLPINREINKIVVVGEHADNSGLQSGGWTVNWQGIEENYTGATTILEGIKSKANGSVVYDKQATGKHFDADVAVIVIGEPPYAEMFGDIKEGPSERKLTLSKAHQEYISTYAKKGIKTVVILISGRPLVTTDQINQSDAFVAAWLPGSEGGGIAEVLFGDYNFKGKLPHSWPKAVEDFGGKYGINFWNASINPLFNFGYGLNYSEE
jgi:beta-glucosidase